MTQKKPSDETKKKIVADMLLYANRLRSLRGLEASMIRGFFQATGNNTDVVNYDGLGNYSYQGRFLGRDQVRVSLFTVCDNELDSILENPNHHLGVRTKNINYVLNDSGTIDATADHGLFVVDAPANELQEELQYGLKVADFLQTIIVQGIVNEAKK